jgi:hypothetical protein
MAIAEKYFVDFSGKKSTKTGFDSDVKITLDKYFFETS